jgi:acylphosphatase
VHTIRVHLHVRGRVQGVGFRSFVHHEAKARALSGWVRNRPDGTVEIEAEGIRAELDAFVEAVRRGSVVSRVEHVHETWSQGPARHRGFVIDG